MTGDALAERLVAEFDRATLDAGVSLGGAARIADEIAGAFRERASQLRSEEATDDADAD